MAADRANERNARRDGLLHAARGAASAPSLLLLRGDGGRSSGVYRCPGRQLGVLRFALRETVPFSVFRLLSLRTRGTGSLALSRSHSRPTRSALATSSARFLPEGSTSTPLAPRRPVRFKSRVYSLGDVSSLIIKIYFYLRNKKVPLVIFRNNISKN